MNSKKIVLTPFSAESVMLYHKLKREGTEAIFFFDSNPLLEGKTYDGIAIARMFYIDEATVIVNSKAFYEQIKNQLMIHGFDENQIESQEEYLTEEDYYEAASMVDADTFAELRPEQKSIL